MRFKSFFAVAAAATCTSAVLVAPQQATSATQAPLRPNQWQANFTAAPKGGRDATGVYWKAGSGLRGGKLTEITRRHRYSAASVSRVGVRSWTTNVPRSGWYAVDVSIVNPASARRGKNVFTVYAGDGRTMTPLVGAFDPRSHTRGSRPVHLTGRLQLRTPRLVLGFAVKRGQAFVSGVSIRSAAAKSARNTARSPIAVPMPNATFRNVQRGAGVGKPVLASGQGPKRYVSITGSDAGNGSAKRPWRTLQWAADHATSGTTITVSRGRYAGFVAKRARLAFVGQGAATTVAATARGRDVIAIKAPSTAIKNLRVTGCLPATRRDERYERNGTANISVGNGAHGSAIRNVTIAGNRGARNQFGLKFGCFGVAARSVDRLTVTRSNIGGTGYGIYVNGGGSGDVITYNSVHDNQVMIRNTPHPRNDDFGGGGIGVTYASPAKTVLVQHNIIANNYASSSDYHQDGQTIEIYQAWNVRFDSNYGWNNVNAFESGALPRQICGRYWITNNVFSGLTQRSKVKVATGLIMRCSRNAVVANNTLSNFNWFTFEVLPTWRRNDAPNGLRILNNVVSQGWNAVWHLYVNPARRGWTVSGNRYNYVSTFGVNWQRRSLALQPRFMTATGLE